MISLTDKFGIPITDESTEYQYAQKYFGDIISHLNRKQAAKGSASGLIYPNRNDKAEDYIYKPRITFDVNEITEGVSADMALYACYAYHSLYVRYRQQQDKKPWYEIMIEKRKVIYELPRTACCRKMADTQEEVVKILKNRLKPEKEGKEDKKDE